MTEDSEDFDPENPTESLSDVGEALEAEGAVPDEGDESGEGEDSEETLPGPLSAITELSGTGNSLESYQDSPIASAIGDEDSKGALHIARGIDGISPVGALNPLVDIGIGVVLIQLEKKDTEAAEAGDFEAEQANPGDDPKSKADEDSRVGGDLS